MTVVETLCILPKIILPFCTQRCATSGIFAVSFYYKHLKVHFQVCRFLIFWHTAQECEILYEFIRPHLFPQFSAWKLFQSESCLHYIAGSYGKIKSLKVVPILPIETPRKPFQCLSIKSFHVHICHHLQRQA